MRRFLLTLLLLVSGFSSFAQAPAPEKLRVVTKDLEPFSFMQNGRRAGYAIELWEQIAREIGVQFELQQATTAKQMIEMLERKEVDVAVGGLSVTAEREKIVDFSQPFFNAGLQILVAGNEGGGGAWQSAKDLFRSLFNWQLIGAFLGLIVAMLVISHLVWMYEHKVNADMWPESYKHGMWESFWWTISTLLVGGADNKGPVGVGGRIVAIIWMLLSIVLVSLLTASFTTTLTVNTLKGDINGPGDLPGRKVATTAGSTSEKFLTSIGAQVTGLANVDECVKALQKGQVKAVVFDSPILQYLANKSSDSKLSLVGPVFETQDYAFGLQRDSVYRKRINAALLSLKERGLTVDLRKKWFGEAAQ